MIDPGNLRLVDIDRPWYVKALNLLPKKDESTILELGSGNGEFAMQLSKKTKFLTCTDYSKIYIKRLKKKGLKAIQADFNQPLPFKNRQFDLVISLEVIEHLVKVEEFLTEIRRILKPKGRLILSSPNIAWWGYRLMALLGQPPKKEGYHLRYFTYHTLLAKLNSAGFTLLQSNSFTTIPLLNRLLIFFHLQPIYPAVRFWPNLLAQDLVFLCQKR